jgi:hypothetical protein
MQFPVLVSKILMIKFKDGKLLPLGIIPKIGLINIKLWKKNKRKKKNFLIWVS